MRVWIEGNRAGGPMSAGRTWASQAPGRLARVRASDLPPEGLDSARLRFELMTPGVLWIDDLRVIGDGAGESARLNAADDAGGPPGVSRAEVRRVCAAGGSHWVRPSAGPSARLARAGEPPVPPRRHRGFCPMSDRKLR